MSTKTSPDVDAYIARFPPGVQAALSEVRATIRSAAPAATERMSYGIPTYSLGANLVHFAAFKRHIGLYPTPGAIEAFREELGRFKCSKGAIQLPLDRPLPLDLIRRIVEARVREAR